MDLVDRLHRLPADMQTRRMYSTSSHTIIIYRTSEKKKTFLSEKKVVPAEGKETFPN